MIIVGFANHPWSAHNRQRLFYEVKNVMRPGDETYRVNMTHIIYTNLVFFTDFYF